MRKISVTLVALAAAAGLAACAVDEYNTGVAGSYEGYYDDYYGPISDGYWGPDGYFYFSAGRGIPFRRDDGFHFRHGPHAGFHHFHGSHMVGY